MNSLLSIKEKNNKLYIDNIKKILSKDYLYISTNNYEDMFNPIIIPIVDTDEVVIQVFESLDLAKEYQNNNPIKFTKISINEFYLLIDKLFFKGITGVLVMSKCKECMTMYYSIIDFLNIYGDGENKLINTENMTLVRELRKVLIQNKFLNYIYHKTLTTDEILYCIVKYNIEDEDFKKCINLFTSEEIAEKYCKKNNIKDIRTNDYPITTVINNVLYHSIVKLKGCVDFINIYCDDKKYKINIDDFIYLIINVGFEQLNLD